MPLSEQENEAIGAWLEALIDEFGRERFVAIAEAICSAILADVAGEGAE